MTIKLEVLIIGTAAFAVGHASAASAPSDLERLQRERSQQQQELNLRMQQQQDRPAQPPNAGDGRTLQLERDQLQRQRQGYDERSRQTIGSDPSPQNARRDPERLRADQTNAEELKRFEAERHREAERSVIPTPAVILTPPAP